MQQIILKKNKKIKSMIVFYYFLKIFFDKKIFYVLKFIKFISKIIIEKNLLNQNIVDL